jgi:hypothetical protein
MNRLWQASLERLAEIRHVNSNIIGHVKLICINAPIVRVMILRVRLASELPTTSG